MKKKLRWVIYSLLCLCLVAAIAWGPLVSMSVEQAKYSIVSSQGAIELRDYDAMIVAETEVAGERKEAISQGFRLIADYIFGNNTAAQKIAMTAPVIQESSQKIAMTAPVTQQPVTHQGDTQQGEGANWKVRFVMPSHYTLATIPKPANNAVILVKVPSKRFAVIRFSGAGDEERLSANTAKLEAYIEANQLTALSPPTFAFFNPPWTLPFLRRNEVMVEVAE